MAREGINRREQRKAFNDQDRKVEVSLLSNVPTERKNRRRRHKPKGDITIATDTGPRINLVIKDPNNRELIRDIGLSSLGWNERNLKNSDGTDFTHGQLETIYKYGIRHEEFEVNPALLDSEETPPHRVVAANTEERNLSGDETAEMEITPEEQSKLEAAAAKSLDPNVTINLTQAEVDAGLKALHDAENNSSHERIKEKEQSTSNIPIRMDETPPVIGEALRSKLESVHRLPTTSDLDSLKSRKDILVGSSLPPIDETLGEKRGRLRSLVGKLVGSTVEGTKWYLNSKEDLIRRVQDLDLEAEKIGGVEVFFRKMGEGYNKLNWKGKLAVGVGLGVGAGLSAASLPAVSALCMGGIAAQRVAGMMNMYLKFEKKALDKKVPGDASGENTFWKWGVREKAMGKAFLYTMGMTGAALSLKRASNMLTSTVGLSRRAIGLGMPWGIIP